MNKLTKTATTLDKVFHVLQIVLTALAIASAVCVALAGIGYFAGLDPATIDHESIDLGFLELELASSFVPNKWIILLQVVVVLALCGITALVGRNGVVCIRSILKPMTVGQPFDGAVSVNLKKLSAYNIAIGILGNAAILADEILTVFAYDLSALLNSEKVVGITTNFTFDFSFLIISAVFMLLSYVFHYGQELQALSDETL